LIGWWSGAWWVWLIIGISGISAISTTLRYIAYRAGTKRSGNYYPQDNYDANSQIDENVNHPVSSGSVRIIEFIVLIAVLWLNKPYNTFLFIIT